jgi:hypothetical protein
MPTGYTSILDDSKEDVSLRDFVFRCAHAFFYDSDAEQSLPQARKPTPYHADAIAKAEADLKMLGALSAAECEERAREDFEKHNAEWIKSAKKSQREIAAYARMVELVEAWKLPTPKHKALKEFMLEQLKRGKPFDMGKSEWKPKRVGGAAWRDQGILQAQKDFAYHTAELEKEQANYRDSVTWLQELGEAFK